MKGIAVTPLPPERVNLECQTNDRTPRVPQGEVDTFVEAQRADHQTLITEGDIAVFNGASRALVALQELKKVVGTALAGLDSYDPLEAARLIRARGEASAALDAVNELHDLSRRAQADQFISDMRARRQAADASIELAQTRIEGVIADLKEREPVNQIIVGLQVLSFAMRMYTAVEGYLASVEAEGESTAESAAVSNEAQAAVRPDEAAVSEDLDNAATNPTPGAGPPAALSSEALATPEEASAFMLSDREKMYRATTIAERLWNDPDRDNPLPHELGADEIAAMEIIPLITGMPETAADKLADALRDEHDDIAWDLVTEFIDNLWSNDDPAGIDLPAPAKAFFIASRPNVAAPAGILDREARLSVTQQLIHELWHRMEIRNRRDFPSETVESSIPPAPPSGPVLRAVRP